MSQPSLAQATSTHLDTACKHIQQCRVSQDHMIKFVKPGLDSDDLIRNKYRYCVHKDELVLGIGKCWAPDAQSKRFQNNAYPRVVSNLGGLVERDGDQAGDAEKLIKVMYHNATSIPERDWILQRFREGNAADFARPGAGAADVNFQPDLVDAQHMRFRQVIPNIHDFVTVGYANTLGWAHAHCGDTMTSVLIGGLRTVMNGDFEVHTGDMIQWYWPFELACFESSARSARSHRSSSSSSWADRALRASRRAAGSWPFKSRSISNRASIRFTASKAMGEISFASLPLRMLPAISASSKNLRRACDQHSAGRTGPGLRSPR